MQYLRRAVKYIFYFGFWCGIGVLGIYLYYHSVNPDVRFYQIFNEGAVPQILIFILAVAAVYPKLGFTRKKVYTANPEDKASDCVEMIRKVCPERGFVFVEQKGDIVKIRAARPVARVTKMMEDTITITLHDNEIELEGLRKDVYRIASALNYEIFRQQNQRNQQDEEQNNPSDEDKQ